MLKKILAAILIFTVASCQDNGSLSVRVSDASHVAVHLAGAPPSQYILVTQDNANGVAEPYFVGNIRKSLPPNLKFDLPKDFGLFDNVKTGPTFNADAFPVGKYGVSFYIDPGLAFSRKFEVASTPAK